MTTVEVIEGDIAQVPADAVVAPVSSMGDGMGGVNNAVRRVAGDMFHAQLSPWMIESTAILTSPTAPHAGQFRDVIFVVDDVEAPLPELVLAALRTAEAHGLHTVTLPALRTGPIASMRASSSRRQVLSQLAAGVQRFLNTQPTRVQQVQFVVYADPGLAAELRRALEAGVG